MITRPMLAASVTGAELGGLRYPVLASPKLDGIRCLCLPDGYIRVGEEVVGGPVTRKFKPVPNLFVRDVLRNTRYTYLDGEIMMFDASGKPLDFNSIQSAIMSRHGEPHFEYWVFDCFAAPEIPFEQRLQLAGRHSKGVAKLLPHVLCNTPEELQQYATEQLEAGWEGIVFRDPKGPYKSGRSTLKQQWMVKYKEFHDAEGTVVGFEELYRNQNEQERDAFGLAERSDRKEGMVAAGTLGALILDTRWGRLRVGTGFDTLLRDEVWANRDTYLGRVVTFKYQPYGMQGLPRFPVFMRFRED